MNAEPKVSGLSSNRWYALIVLTLVYTLNIADRFVMSVLIEPIKADLNLSDAAVGMLTGVALAIFYALAGMPIAALADRSNRRNIVAICVALWSGLTALCAATTTYLQLLLVRIGVGIGEAGGTAPSHSILADLFSWRDRGLAMAIFGLGVSLGSALAAFGGVISDEYGWRAVFLIFGIPGVFLALLVVLTIREPQRGQSDERASEVSAGLVDCLLYSWKTPALRHMMFTAVLFPLWGWGLLWWTPSFFIRSFEVSLAEIGALLSWVHLIGGTASLIASTFVMRWLANKPASWTPAFGALTILLGAVPSVVLFSAQSLTLATAMLWIFVAMTYASFGATFALIQNLSPAPMRAQMAAIALFLTNIANLAIAPQLVGLASDLLAPRYGSESLRFALIPLTFVGFWAAYHYWAIGFKLSEGMRAAGNDPGADAHRAPA